MRYLLYWIKDGNYILLQKFYSGDYLFIYAYDDNNVFVLLHPTTDSADTPEAEITNEEVVDTMGDDMLDEIT